MSDNTNEILGRVAVAGMQKCAESLSRVSAGIWSISGVDVSVGTLAGVIKRRGSDAGETAAVYFDVKGEQQLIAMVLFDLRDMDRISQCFLGYSFAISPGLSQAGELLLTELGNIILNSFISGLSNTLKRILMPSAPACLRGGPNYLLGALGAVMDVEQRYRIVSIKMSVQRDKSVTRSEVLGLIPEKLAQELLKIEEKDKRL